jgi:actin-related protein
VNSLFVTDASVASLYSVGKTGGIVVDIGYEKIGE